MHDLKIGRRVKITRTWEGTISNLLQVNNPLAYDREPFQIITLECNGEKFQFNDPEEREGKGYVTTIDVLIHLFEPGDILKGKSDNDSNVRTDVYFTLLDEGYAFEGTFVKWGDAAAFPKHVFNDHNFVKVL
jgi:hypothetical protein